MLKIKCLSIKLQDELSKDSVNKKGYLDDILTKALGTPGHRGRVRGVEGLITPSFYFHKHIPTKPTKTQMKDDPKINWIKEKAQILEQYNLVVKCMHELNIQMKVEEACPDAHDHDCDQNTASTK